MIAVPPLFRPAVQVNLIVVAEVVALSFARLIGASGTNTTIPPLPPGECNESPKMFVATTCAQI